MTEKNLLITSMQKLISHISKSKKNQQQIFNSLNKNDFKKILTNLDDEHITLRKTSLKLLAELLWTNSPLKRTFCNVMEINMMPGNVVLNHKTLQKVNSYMILKELTSLLKNSNKKGQSDCLLWYIKVNRTYNNQPLKIEYLSKSDLEKPQAYILDPLNCIIGMVLTQNDVNPYVKTSSEQFNKIKLIHQAQTKSSLRGMIESGYPFKTEAKDQVAAEIGVGYQKYQKLNRSIQLQNQPKPKKFLNNYFQNHRINQTAKISQVNQSTTNNKNMNNSLEVRQPRSSLTNQDNQKITILSFQNRPSNNITISTDRYAEDFVSNNNRSIKDYDFQRLKYQGIKVTSNNTSKNINSKPVKQLLQNSFKYIKPMTSTTGESKFISFPNKNERGHQTLRQKQTIDVFQYIKNR